MAKRKSKKQKEKIIKKENLNPLENSENEELVPEDSQENVLEPPVVTISSQNKPKKILSSMPRINLKISK